MFSLIRSTASRIIPRRYYRDVKWSRFPLEYKYTSGEETQISTLKNGLRVVTHRVKGPTATVGLFIDSGSRVENDKNNGVAHFFEHMAFKGTKNLSRFNMESLVEKLGTRLFAYTSREQTVYYGKCFQHDGPKVVEILSDIIQNPLLETNAIENERNVILSEMRDIETQIDEVVFDNLHGTAYQGCPLGYTILGPTENIKSINRDDLLNYINQHYTAERTVLVAVGEVDHEEYVKLAEKHLSRIPSKPETSSLWYKPSRYLGSSALFRNDDMPFAYVAYGYEAVPPTHPDFFPLMIANTYLGSYDQSCTNGKVMPTKLAQRTAENDAIRGYSTFYAAYKDTALWGVYYRGKGLQIDRFAFYLAYELKHLQTAISDGSVDQAKNALKTNFFTQIDGTTPLFEEIGRQILTYGRRVYDEEFEKLIDNCTVEDVQRAMTDMIVGKDPVLTAIGPIEGLIDYVAIRRMAVPIIG